jgi:hypothetical protein
MHMLCGAVAVLSLSETPILGSKNSVLDLGSLDPRPSHYSDPHSMTGSALEKEIIFVTFFTHYDSG